MISTFVIQNEQIKLSYPLFFELYTLLCNRFDRLQLLCAFRSEHSFLGLFVNNVNNVHSMDTFIESPIQAAQFGEIGNRR